MTSSAPGTGRWRRPAHVAYVVDDGTAVLLHLPSGRRTALSETATAVWLLLVDAGVAGVEVTELAPALAERYDADPGRVAVDVEQLLADLESHQLAEGVR